MKRTKEFTTPQEQEHLASTMLAETQRAVTESNHYSNGEIASESDSDGEWKVLSTPTSQLGPRAQVTSDSDSNGQPPLKSESELVLESISLPVAQHEQVTSDYDSNVVSTAEMVQSQLDSDFESDFESDLESESTQTLPLPDAGSNFPPYLLTGAALLALVGYCYMNQDELCALLIGYDDACTLKSAFGYDW